MYTFLSIVYVLVCLFLVFVVLLQPGRGGGMGSSFGGGSSNTVFGASGAGNFLTRLTTASAATFMILSVLLAYMSSGSDKSLEMASTAAKAKQEAKAKEDAKKGKETPNEGTPPQVEGMSPGSAPINIDGLEPSEMPEAQEPAPSLEAPAAEPTPAAEPAPVGKPAANKPAAKPALEKPAAKPAKPALDAPAKPAVEPREVPATAPVAPLAAPEPTEPAPATP